MTPKSNKFFSTTLFYAQNCEIFENIFNLCSHYFYLKKILSERKNLRTLLAFVNNFFFLKNLL